MDDEIKRLEWLLARIQLLDPPFRGLAGTRTKNKLKLRLLKRRFSLTCSDCGPSNSS